MASQSNHLSDLIIPRPGQVPPSLLSLPASALPISVNKSLAGHGNQLANSSPDAVDTPNLVSKSSMDYGMNKGSSIAGTLGSTSVVEQPLISSDTGPLVAMLLELLESMSVTKKNPKTESDEAVTTLRIRVAVLENELKHANQERGSLVSGLATVVGIISSTQAANQAISLSTAKLSTHEDSTKELEREIERLRKENKSLRSKLRELSGNSSSNANVNVQSHNALQDSPPPGYATDSSTEPETRMKGNPINRLVGNGQYSGPTPTELAGSWASQQKLLYSEGFEFGANSGQESSMSTIPNALKSESSAFISSNPDLAILSLEEILESGEFGASDTPYSPKIDAQPSSNSSSSENQAFDGYLPGNFDLDNEKTMNEKVEENGRAMAKFKDLPTPGLLKVGGTVKDSFRGKEYEPRSIPSTNYPNSPRGSRAAEHQPIYKHQRSPGRDFDAESVEFHEIPNDSQHSFPNSMWNSAEEREDVLKEHARHCGNSRETRFPDFFRYGIQFVPGKLDGNYMRTVHIEGLPPNTKLRDVLARVRGGEIMSAILLDTKALIGGFLSARIVFKTEGTAEDYVNWAASHPITFISDADDEQHEAAVALISTPTYPPTPRTKQKLGISSRCICIPSFPHNFPIRYLEKDIACGSKTREESLLEIWLDENSTLHMEFSSLDMAGSALAILSNWQSYRNAGIQVRYENDPCAGSVEELLDEVKPRPKLLPDNFNQDKADSMSSAGRKIGLSADRDVSEGRPAIINTNIIIPSFSGNGLGTASWADEVNDEIEAEVSMETSPSPLFMNAPVISMPPADSSNSHCEDKSSKSTPYERPFSAVLTPHTSSAKVFDQSIDSVLATDNANAKASMDSKVETGDRTVEGLRRNFGSAGLAGSEYANNIPTFLDSSEPRPSLSSLPLSCENSIPGHLQRHIAGNVVAIRSPPVFKLEDLIGEDSDELGDEVEVEIRLPLLANKPSLASESAKADSVREGQWSSLPKSYNSLEQTIDEANLSLPTKEFDLGTFNNKDLEASYPGAARMFTATTKVEAAKVKETSRILDVFKKSKIESSNPAFRATNMNGGMNPSEITLDD